jgi:hypothetical protein
LEVEVERELELERELGRVLELGRESAVGLAAMAVSPAPVAASPGRR